MKPFSLRHFLWIAREGVAAPVPKPCGGSGNPAVWNLPVSVTDKSLRKNRENVPIWMFPKIGVPQIVKLCFYFCFFLRNFLVPLPSSSITYNDVHVTFWFDFMWCLFLLIISNSYSSFYHIHQYHIDPQHNHHESLSYSLVSYWSLT